MFLRTGVTIRGGTYSHVAMWEIPLLSVRGGVIFVHGGRLGILFSQLDGMGAALFGVALFVGEWSLEIAWRLAFLPG